MGEMNDFLWMVRAGRGAAYVESFLDGGFVSMGFGHELGVSIAGLERAELLARLKAHYPSRKEGRVLNAAAQGHRFCSEVQVGHEVLTYDAGRRYYYLGTVQGAVSHHPDGEPGLTFRRKVKWTSRVSRDELSVATRNTLGSTLTLFLLNDEAAAEVRTKAVPIDSPEPAHQELRPAEPSAEESASLDDLLTSMVSRAGEFIEDRIMALEPADMEHLVAGILRAMGYKARVSPTGADRGIDIFASPDGLGLQEPRIFVEVKHRKASMGSQEIRSFLGGRQPGDRCLFVSTGGFTREARYEAERSNVPLTLVDLPLLRELLVDHYDAMPVEAQQLVPLTRLHWPVVAADG
jgi:restriction system protein